MISLSEADELVFGEFTRLKSGVNIQKALSESLLAERDNLRDLSKLLCQAQGEGELQAAGGAVGNGDCAAVDEDGVLDDGQSQAGAAGTA